jgi:CRISPR/Cas system-associated exonuclease Cas4 (RecB family)
MMLLPATRDEWKGKVFRGEVEYQKKLVPLDALTKKTADLITDTIKRIAQKDPLPAVPTFQACRFCELTKADCPQRVETDTVEPVTTNLF